MNNLYQKISPLIRKAAVFMIILSAAAPVGKAIGVQIYNYIQTNFHPASEYECMIPAVVLGLGVVVLYMDTIYSVMKKYFQSV